MRTPSRCLALVCLISSVTAGVDAQQSREWTIFGGANQQAAAESLLVHVGRDFRDRYARFNGPVIAGMNCEVGFLNYACAALAPATQRQLVDGFARGADRRVVADSGRPLEALRLEAPFRSAVGDTVRVPVFVSSRALPSGLMCVDYWLVRRAGSQWHVLKTHELHLNEPE